MKTIFSTVLGILTISGYMLFESLTYGLFIWAIWFSTNLTILFNVIPTYPQIVAVIFIIKIIKFDPTKAKQPIMILPDKEN